MCDKEIHSRGFWGHVRLFHPENLEKSQEYWAEWKKTKKDLRTKKMETKKEPESKRDIDKENEEIRKKLEKIDTEKISLMKKPKEGIKAEAKKEEKKEKEEKEEKKEEATRSFDFSSLALIVIPLIVGGAIWYFSKRKEKERLAGSIEPKEKYRDFDIGRGKIIKIPIR